MKNLKSISYLALITTCALSAPAQVTFVFHTGSALGPAGTALDDNAGAGTYTLSDITITMEAFTDGVSAGSTLNGAGTGFGVNGSGADTQTQRIDNEFGDESIVFFFDVGGTFDSIDLRYIESSGTEEGELAFDGGNTYQLNSVTATGSTDVAAIGENFTAGQRITLRVHAGAPASTNFSLESLTISPVPEPATYATLAGVVMLGLAAFRRRGSGGAGLLAA